jgi:hypothetical protein
MDRGSIAHGHENSPVAFALLAAEENRENAHYSEDQASRRKEIIYSPDDNGH